MSSDRNKIYLIKKIRLCHKTRNTVKHKITEIDCNTHMQLEQRTFVKKYEKLLSPVHDNKILNSRTVKNNNIIKNYQKKTNNVKNKNNVNQNLK